jgi:hypothetical protein
MRRRNANSRPGALGRRVLGFLCAKSRACTPTEIAEALDEEARRVYAAMSSMGRYQGRGWIMAIGYWDRKSQFHITRQGRERVSSL